MAPIPSKVLPPLGPSRGSARGAARTPPTSLKTAATTAPISHLRGGTPVRSAGRFPWRSQPEGRAARRSSWGSVCIACLPPSPEGDVRAVLVKRRRSYSSFDGETRDFAHEFSRLTDSIETAYAEGGRRRS